MPPVLVLANKVPWTTSVSAVACGSITKLDASVQIFKKIGAGDKRTGDYNQMTEKCSLMGPSLPSRARY